MRCSKTIENSLAFALCLLKEIDASRFSGPEQFSAGAALILLLFAKMIFRRRFDRFRCLDRSRCSKTIENSLAFAICLHKEIDASRFSGPEQFSAGAPLISPYFESAIFRSRFDRFRCVDRSRRSKTIEKSYAFPYVCIRKLTHFDFRGPNNFPPTRR